MSQVIHALRPGQAAALDPNPIDQFCKQSGPLYRHLGNRLAHILDANNRSCRVLTSHVLRGMPACLYQLDFAAVWDGEDESLSREVDVASAEALSNVDRVAVWCGFNFHHTRLALRLAAQLRPVERATKAHLAHAVGAGWAVTIAEAPGSRETVIDYSFFTEESLVTLQAGQPPALSEAAGYQVIETTMLVQGLVTALSAAGIKTSTVQPVPL